MSAEGFDSFQQSYLRILGAAIIAFIFFRRYFSKKLLSSISSHEWSIYGLRAILGYVFGTAVYTIAINNANLSVVAFISAVPTLGFIAYVMFREKIPLMSIPFFVLSLVGVLFLTGACLSNVHFGIGEIAAAISNIGFSVSFLMSRLHDKKRNNFENTTILLALGWIPVLIISLVLHEHVLPHSLSVTSAVGLLLAAVFNVINLYGANYVFTNMKAYVAGNVLLLETIWASIVGLLIYGEPVTIIVAAGGMLIVASALAINRIDNRNEEPPIS